MTVQVNQTWEESRGERVRPSITYVSTKKPNKSLLAQTPPKPGKPPEVEIRNLLGSFSEQTGAQFD